MGFSRHLDQFYMSQGAKILIIIQKIKLLFLSTTIITKNLNNMITIKTGNSSITSYTACVCHIQEASWAKVSLDTHFCYFIQSYSALIFSIICSITLIISSLQHLTSWGKLLSLGANITS